jgi:hypothetical protein
VASGVGRVRVRWLVRLGVRAATCFCVLRLRNIGTPTRADEVAE